VHPATLSLPARWTVSRNARSVTRRELGTGVALVALATVNLWFAAWTIRDFLTNPYAPADWIAMQRWAEQAGTAQIYAFEAALRLVWSPLASFALIPIAALGLTIWRLLHLAAALALPSWRLRLLLLASWPFWYDVGAGNVLTFVLVAAVWALRGSRLATLALFAFAMLIPRPLMVPVICWILWKRPETRISFVAIAAANGVLLALSGLGPIWVDVLLGAKQEGESAIYNVAPSRLIGDWWLLIALPVAVWLLSRGSLGLAALAMSPYWWGYYLVMPLVDVDGHDQDAGRVVIAIAALTLPVLLLLVPLPT
jgi:uncharacterized membrane protein